MQRILVFAYGLISYSVFFGSFLYAIGFVGNFLVPTTLDAAPSSPFGWALGVDLALLALFAIQHSVMARPGFKRWWTRFVPKPMERSTYVLFSSLALILLFWQWQPLGGVIWQVDALWGRTTLWSLFAAGWLLILVSTFLIDHFDLFGLRQVTLYLLGRPYTDRGFVTPSLYRWVRHPLYVGWILALWGAPTMTLSHLVFAVVSTLYILVAIQFEERDLVAALPGYADYRDRVGMLLPRVASSSRSRTPMAGALAESAESITGGKQQQLAGTRTVVTRLGA